jgi:hypothetical protein
MLWDLSVSTKIVFGFDDLLWCGTLYATATTLATHTYRSDFEITSICLRYLDNWATIVISFLISHRSHSQQSAIHVIIIAEHQEQ